VTLGDYSFRPVVNTVMADTGTSLNMIPDDDYYRLFNRYFQYSKCHKLPNTLDSCDCSKAEHEQIPDIKFLIDGDTYSIPRDKWVERADGQCVVKFMHGPSKDYWILGLNFFENYYTVFDYENLAIGFADSINQDVVVGSSFIDWSLGKSTVPNFMNLRMETSNQNLILTAALASVLVVSGYYYMMRKHNYGKIRAQVDPEYFIETVKEDEVIQH